MTTTPNATDRICIGSTNAFTFWYDRPSGSVYRTVSADGDGVRHQLGGVAEFARNLRERQGLHCMPSWQPTTDGRAVLDQALSS